MENKTVTFTTRGDTVLLKQVSANQEKYIKNGLVVFHKQMKVCKTFHIKTDDNDFSRLARWNSQYHTLHNAK